MTIWEKPIINREVSIDNPFPIQHGMVFALETYAGSQDGTFGVRLEEEVLVTEDGCELLTKFPSDDLTESPRR
jgi:Xaa-Pro aminopeptidase